MTERPKVHDWKSCVPQGTGGSNPPFSATVFGGTGMSRWKWLILALVVAGVAAGCSKKEEPAADAGGVLGTPPAEPAGA